MQAQSQPDVLRELGGGWLECQDAQGVFYFNEVTKQSCDEVPPELRAPAPQPQPQVQQPAAQNGVEVLRELTNNWMECHDTQGIFYYNKLTKQSSDDVPPELRAPAASQATYTQPAAPVHLQEHHVQQLQQQLKQQPHQQPYLQPQHLQQQPLAPTPAAATEPTVHAKIGEWSVCEDNAGLYYFHHPTGQSFDKQPAEVAQYFMARKQQQAQPAPSYQPSLGASYLSQMPGHSQHASQKPVVRYQTLGAGAPYHVSSYTTAPRPQVQKQYVGTYSQHGPPGYGQY